MDKEIQLELKYIELGKNKLQLVILLTAIALIVVLLHLMPGLDGSLLDQKIRNALHIVGFAMVAAVVFEVVPARKWKKFVTTLLFTASIGLMSEIAQQLSGSTMDFLDVLRDVAGILLFLAGRYLWQRSNNSAGSFLARSAMRTVSVTLMALIVAPLVQILLIRASLANDFPVILNFDHERTALSWIPVHSSVDVMPGGISSEGAHGSVAHVKLLRQKWSGLIVEPVVKDWTGFSELRFSARLLRAANNSRLSVYLSDGSHVGYRTHHLIGRTDITENTQDLRFKMASLDDMPGRPELDLRRIQDIYFIVRGGHEDATLMLDDIQLH